MKNNWNARAYSELYVEDAMETVAFSFDYAVRALNLSIQEYLEKFVNFEYINLIEAGNPHYVSGISGCELALMVCGLDDGPKSPEYAPWKEYWIGMNLAYYQWYRNLTYRQILEKFPLERFDFAFPAMHQENRRRIVEYMDEVILGIKRNDNQ